MRLVKDILQELKDIQLAFDKTNDKDAVRKCVAEYERLLNEIPDEPEILFQLGTAHLQLGNFGASMPYFQRLLDYWPDNAHVWSNLGCAYRSIHQLPEARAALMKSLMFEERAETLSNLASSYVNEDCPEQGIQFGLRAMEVDPGSAKAKWNTGLLCLEMQDWEKGFSLYEAGLLCGERMLRNYSKDTPDSVQWWHP